MLIALEEHYSWDPVSADSSVGTWINARNSKTYQRLCDRGEGRLEQMDAAGIDFQALSLFDPGVQADTDTARATDNARRANDDLAETVRRHPRRFGGFAALATQDPAGAAAELERAVTDLGLLGALINGHTHGRYLDDPAYADLFDCAQRLGVPIYLHPTTPHPAVLDAWFEPYLKDGMQLAAWGFGVETATHALRLIYSGLFEKFPRLQIILGHLGETLPVAAHRIDRYYGLGGDGGGALPRRPSEYLRSNFHITTSGNFSPAALVCTLEVMGADRVMFAVDYPIDSNRAAAEFLAAAPLDDTTRHRIGCANALRLFGSRIPL